MSEGRRIDGSRFKWVFGVTVLGLALLLYREFILDGAAMLYGDDMINEGFQLRSFGVDEILSGRGFPLWNPFVYGGQPYLAILPGPVFYPSSLLYLVMPLYRAIGWTFVLHTFLSGVFGYAAARSIRLDRVPAAVAGLAFMFTGFVVSTLYGGHDGRMFAMVLIPLAFTLLERGLASGRVHWFLGLGLVVALQIFTPHIQLMYYSSLALSLYAALRIGQKARQEGARTAFALAAKWALAFAVAGLVGAAQLLPTVQILDVAVRGGAGESGYAFASSWALPPQEVSALFLPDLVGSLGTYWGSNPFKLHTEYLGAVPVALAIVALSTIRSDRRVLFLGITGLVCILFALGAATPVHRLAYYTLPFVKQFRAPSMMLGPAALMVALLAGLGWQRVMDLRKDGGEWSWAWIAALAAPLLLLGLAAAFSPEGLLRWARTAWFPAGWTRTATVDPVGALRANGWMVIAGVGGVLAVGWAVATRRGPEWLVAVLLVVLIADGWRVNTRYLRTVEEASVFPTDPVVDHLATSLQPGERVFPPAGMSGYGPSEFSVHRVPTVTGIQKFRLEWYERFTGGLGMQNVGSMTALGLLDVGFIVAGPGLSAEALQLEAEAPRGSAYRVRTEIPHAFFPRTVEATTDTAEALRRVLEADPLDLAIVEAEVAPPAGEGSATITRLDPNHLVLEVDARRGGLLFLSEVYYPAWRASVDGEPTEVLRTNTAFRGIVVPAGRHTVELNYSAAEFRVGFGVSGLTALVVLAALVFRFRRSRGVPADDEDTAGDSG
ncbi:MAG: YfhO family protein [marine benthic group bacterium]|nr:YfhO family protein [Candidatus Benthicola marisminoris]